MKSQQKRQGASKSPLSALGKAHEIIGTGSKAHDKTKR